MRQFTIQAIVEKGNLKRYSGLRKEKAEAVIEGLEMCELMWLCWFSSVGLHGGWWGAGGGLAAPVGRPYFEIKSERSFV